MRYTLKVNAEGYRGHGRVWSVYADGAFRGYVERTLRPLASFNAHAPRDGKLVLVGRFDDKDAAASAVVTQQ